jgi:dCTP deaminase
MVISKTTMESLLFCKDLIVEPRSDQALQPASVDLCLGSRIGKYSTLGELDLHKPAPTVELFDIPPHGYVIPPEGCVLASTREAVRIPLNMCALLTTRSSIARMFLMISTLTGFIDPGFEGTLDLQIFNAGANPVRLYAGDRIAQIVLFQLTTETSGYQGKYQKKNGVVGYSPDPR